MKFSFANRIDELRTLAKFCAASDIQDGVSIVVVHGAEGVGKSTVIRKAIHENFHDEHIHVEVSFNPYRDHESGTYIKNIAKEVSSFFQKEGSPFSLEAFLAKGYSGHLVRRVAESIGMDLAAIVPGLSGPVKELKTSAKEIMDLKNAILSNGNSETAELAANYVAHVAKSRKVIIHIQNFQNIDQVSLGTLEDNISLFRNVYFFLEWSDRDDKKYKDHNIVKQLKYAAPFTFEIEVGKLPIEELYEQILANQSIIYKLVASAYDKETGNLRDLERMLSSEHGLGVDLSIDRANTENLKSLSRARLVLIIIVCLTNEQASFDLLKEICATCDQKTRSLISNEMSRDSDIYLTRTENGLKIDHDSTIRRVMTLADFDFERQYGAQIIKRYIDSKHATIKDMSVSTLLQYMQLSTICNDTDNLFWSLREFESKFQHSKFPPEILNQILDFSLRIVRLDSNNYNTLLMYIMHILFKNNLIVDCIPITQHLAKTGGVAIYYHITSLLSGLQLIAANQWLCALETQQNSPSKKGDASENYENCILASLLRVWYLRLVGDLEKSQSLYEKVEPNRSASTYIKAIYYRYCEIANHRDATTYLEKALSLAVEIDDMCLQNEIKLALAMYHAESEEIETALKLIEEIKCSGQICGFLHMYALENDKVVCSILKHEPVSLDVLKEYRMNIVDPFDKLIIENNIMLGELGNGNIAKAQFHAAKSIGIVEASNFIEPNIVRITYINASYVFLQCGDNDESERFWRAANGISSSVDVDYWKRLFICRGPRECEKKIGFYAFPPFMTNWNIDPSTFLERA